MNDLVTTAGVLTIGAVVCHVIGLTVMMGGAARRKVDMTALVIPLRHESLAAYTQMAPFPWYSSLVGLGSLVLMTFLPIGFIQAMPDQANLTVAAALLHYSGLVFGVIHSSLFALILVHIAGRHSTAEAGLRDRLLEQALVMFDAHDVTEKFWGLVRSVAALVYTIAIARHGDGLGWLFFVGVVCSLELPFRLVTVPRNRDPMFIQDIFFVLWLLGAGIALATGTGLA